MRIKILLSILIAIPLLVFAQSDIKKKVYYFYGEQCPHCQKVDEFLKANGAYEKYEIIKLEATANPFNGKLFLDFGKAFGVSDWGGVPTVVFGNSYLIGDTPIIENFFREIDAAENANELPNPEEIKKLSDDPVQENQSIQESKEENDTPAAENSQPGDKNKYFPVIMIALVLVGGGALVYSNRNKSKE